MGSVLEQLKRREAAALARVEELRAKAQDVANRLDAARDELSRLEIARRTVAEVLAGEPGGEAAGEDVAPPSGPALGARGSLRDVTVYQRIVSVFVTASGPLRSRDVCDALGIGVEARYTEAMRSKLKRLVADGTLVEVEPGLFARTTVETAA
ncbi:hypothetical protein ACNPQM_33505 [Streptomyces sp. NPDC056231]|uniref:hypothetical protein n=1 Tax=Streptomyces sp. NPDC056231 TaxID=3345755 RepID=UPI003AACF5BD